MNNEYFFHEFVKKPLNALLVELSRNNIDMLASRSQENFTHIIDKILKSNYFQASVRDRYKSYDCHARFKYTIKEGEPLEFSSSYPLCLAPIPNENFFYCRGNLSEGTRSKYDEIIPSRDYSCCSYEWKYLYCVEHAVEALRLISQQLSEYKTHRIHLFGLLRDQQRSFSQTISSKALTELFSEAKTFKNMCASEGFDFFALSLNHSQLQISTKRYDAVPLDDKKASKESLNPNKPVKGNAPKQPHRKLP